MHCGELWAPEFLHEFCAHGRFWARKAHKLAHVGANWPLLSVRSAGFVAVPTLGNSLEFRWQVSESVGERKRWSICGFDKVSARLGART